MNRLWDEAFSAFGLSPTETQRRQLDRYTSELLAVNQKLNLVKADDEETLLRRHLFDALAGLPVLGTAGPATAADVGSGCGIPGIPLAVFWTSTRMTLIERSAKRASFLRYAAAVCGLGDRVCIENRDLKNLDSQFDCVTFRAFRQFDEFIAPLLTITKAGGMIAAYKGTEKAVRHDLNAARPEFAKTEIKILDNPFYQAERHLLLIEKV